MGVGRGESCWCACAWSRGYSLVADGPLEPDALLALEEALRVDLGLDRLELREAVRAPDVLLHRDALLLALGVREVVGAVSGVVVLERTERVPADVRDGEGADAGGHPSSRSAAVAFDSAVVAARSSASDERSRRLYLLGGVAA